MFGSFQAVKPACRGVADEGEFAVRDQTLDGVDFEAAAAGPFLLPPAGHQAGLS
jgi:hypothetical protein